MDFLPSVYVLGYNRVAIVVPSSKNNNNTNTKPTDLINNNNKTGREFLGWVSEQRYLSVKDNNPTIMTRNLLSVFVVSVWSVATAFHNNLRIMRGNHHHHLLLHHNSHHFRSRIVTVSSMALGDFTVELEKPLGIILEEREIGGNGGGVRVKEILPDGAAASTSKIVPGDVILQVNQIDVSTSDFDSVMDLLIEAPTSSLVELTLGDGLGTMDMPKNVLGALKNKEDAFFVDAVVREAVREIRRDGRLGDLLKVEVVVGAGVKDEGRCCMVRFFAIFSTDGVSTYSCNVSATGVRGNDDDVHKDSIKIISLSCAKDEGLGRTYDLIREL